MNKALLILSIILISFSLIGCWNYRELNDIFIVAGIAVDRDKESGLFNVTAEIVNADENKQSPYSERVECSGESIFRAIRNMIRTTSRKLYFSHATTIIISEDMAKESVLPILDWVARDQEPRLSMNIFISREKTAKEILELDTLSSPAVVSYELEVMTNENTDLIESPVVSVYELINLLAIPKTHAILPALEVTSNNNRLSNALSGCAIFNNDKLTGYLEQDDMLYYMLLLNKVDGGLISISADDDVNHSVDLEIFNSKTSFHPTYSGEELVFNIDVEVEASIGEINSKKDFISKPGRNQLQSMAEKLLKERLESLIERVQQDFGLDIFGFGNIIRQRNPKVWKTIEKDWDAIFKELNVNITTEFNIKNSGHFSKPIEVFK